MTLERSSKQCIIYIIPKLCITQEFFGDPIFSPLLAVCYQLSYQRATTIYGLRGCRLETYRVYLKYIADLTFKEKSCNFAKAIQR